MSFWNALSELAEGASRAFKEIGKSAWGWQTGANAITPTQFLTGSDTLEQIQQNIRQPYAQQATVFRAVRSIATSVGQLESEVWPDDIARSGDSPIESHWLTDLLDSPSPTLRGDQLIEVVVTWLELFGEAFIWHQAVARDAGTGVLRPHALSLLPPHAMKHKTTNGVIEQWEYRRPTGTIKIPAEEITFLKYPNPYDEFRGLATILAAHIEVTGDFKMAIWNKSVYENSAIPPVLFIPKDQEWLEEDRERFMIQWDQKYAGVTRAGKSAALPMNIEAVLLKQGQKDMEFLLGRRFSREQILSVFGVPPAIAGVFEFANYANSREQMKFYWHNTLLPKVRYIQRILTADLLNRYEQGVSLWFKVESVLADIAAADFAAKATTAQTLMSMGFPPSDINDRLGLGMDTKNKPWLDEGWLAFGLSPARDLVPTSTPPPPEPSDDDDDVPEPPDEEAIRRRILHQHQRSLMPHPKVLDPKELWSGLARQWADIGRAYARRLRSWLWELRLETLAALDKVQDEKGVRRKAISEDDLGTLLFDLENADIKLKTISRTAWTRAAERGTTAVAGEIGTAIAFDILDPKIQQFMAAKVMSIRGITPGIQDRLRKSLSAGFGKGESVRDLSKRVTSVFNVERHRANTIARTETAQSFTFGRFNAMEEAGVRFHRWLSSQDTLVRDDHIAVHGDVVPVGGIFAIPQVRYPAEVGGPPGQVINCRCSTMALSPDEEQELVEAQ